MKHSLIFDIETDGLYHNVTKCHSIVIYDTETDEITRYSKFDEPLFKAIEHLNQDKELVGHNIINYDIPVLHKLFPKFKWKDREVFDTLLMAEFVITDLEKTDLGRITAGKLPKKLYQSHSLSAWGYRLGNFKGDYGERFKDESDEDYMARVWATVSKEMVDYNVQDVQTTRTLYQFLKNRIEQFKVPKTAMDIEHQFATILSRQMRFGVLFDIQKAEKLEKQLRLETAKALDECLSTYKPKWFNRGAKPTKYIEVKGKGYWCHEAKVNRRETITLPNGKTLKTTSKIKGALFNNIELQEFNPSSSKHIIRWLTEDYGWIPTEFTDKGEPKTDGDTLASLTFNGIKPIQKYQMLTKRLSQLADGKGSLLNNYDKYTGRIYGRVKTLGAVSRRCTHSSPNLAQVPAVDIEYGKEFRELFTIPKDYLLVGADASGLELRTLSHYLYAFDGGEYGNIVLDGDIHTKNQEDAGLPTRNNAKTFIYAFLYGAGDEKIGEIIMPNGTAEQKKKAGKTIKDKFKKSNPNFDKLTKLVSKKAKERGYILDKDGKKLFIRSVHSALNLLLQSCGAIIMKYWLVNVDRELQRLGWLNSDDIMHNKDVHEVDYEFVLNIHDEAQTQVKAHKAEQLAQIKVAQFPITGEQMGINIRIDGEAKMGLNWAETH